LALKIKLKGSEAVELVSSYSMLSKVHIEEKGYDKAADNISKAIKIIDANPSLIFAEQPMLYYCSGQVNLLSKDSNVKKAI
jgi:hypothetical protein